MNMNRSVVLSTTIDLLHPLLMIFSFFLLLRGHNNPGGGFVGGLMASAGYALYALAHGVLRTRVLVHVHPRFLVALGLGAALGSGLPSLVTGKPFLTGFWSGIRLPVIDKIGTPLLFDAGVYLVVMGTTLLIIFSLMEE